MQQHWLFKSEPFKFSWEMMKAAGREGTARNHLPGLVGKVGPVHAPVDRCNAAAAPREVKV